MPKLSKPKAKGDAYERELASYLDKHLFGGSSAIRRAPLSGGGHSFKHDMGGGGGGADLVGTPRLWVEAKRTERFSPYEAIAQAERGRAGQPGGNDDLIAVISRRNLVKTEDSLVVMRLGEWLKLYATYINKTPSN